MFRRLRPAQTVEHDRHGRGQVEARHACPHRDRQPPPRARQDLRREPAPLAAEREDGTMPN